jgi:hypothetical protein
MESTKINKYWIIGINMQMKAHIQGKRIIMNLFFAKKYWLFFIISLLLPACMDYRENNNEKYIKVEAVILKYKKNSWGNLSEGRLEEKGDSTTFKVISPEKYKDKLMTYLHKIPPGQPQDSLWRSVGQKVVFYVKGKNIVKAPLGSNYDIWAIKDIEVSNEKYSGWFPITF